MCQQEMPSDQIPSERDSLLPLVSQRSTSTKNENNHANDKVEKNSNIVDNDDDCNPWTDAKDTLYLGIPIFLATTSFAGMRLTDSALLGHVSAQALAAASLSDLWTMCTAVLLQGRVLGVLTGAAIGAGNYKLAGIYLQVSCLCLGCISVLVMISWWMTGWIWKWFGTDDTVASMAGYYATILSVTIPAQVAFGQLSQFFSSQRIMHPEVRVSSFALLLNLILGLTIVLGIPIPGFEGYGFKACPMVTAAIVNLQVVILVGVYCGRQKLHQSCWGGWDWQAIRWERISTFLNLYIPAALGIASDYWRVAVVGAMAAKLGTTQVAVFTAAYRIMDIGVAAISSLASAAAIKMTLRLGRNQGNMARQAGMVGIAMSGVFLLILGVLVHSYLPLLGRLFTDDVEFLDYLEEVGLPFTVALVLMNFAVALERLPYAMGRTKEIFWYGFVASWVFQVPAVYISTIFWRDDLTGLFSGMAIGYGSLVILYGCIILTSDWDFYAQLAVQRSEISTCKYDPVEDTDQSDEDDESNGDEEASSSSNTNASYGASCLSQESKTIAKMFSPIAYQRAESFEQF